jgi:hypothetical protein
MLTRVLETHNLKTYKQAIRMTRLKNNCALVERNYDSSCLFASAILALSHQNELIHRVQFKQLGFH